MDLESLLQANMELQKRIATDQLLRQFFSDLWKESTPRTRAIQNSSGTQASPSPSEQTLELTFPTWMCEQLERLSRQTGKSVAQLLQESFSAAFPPGPVKKL